MTDPALNPAAVALATVNSILSNPSVIDALTNVRAAADNRWTTEDRIQQNPSEERAVYWSLADAETHAERELIMAVLDAAQPEITCEACHTSKRAVISSAPPLPDGWFHLVQQQDYDEQGMPINGHWVFCCLACLIAHHHHNYLT